MFIKYAKHFTSSTKETSHQIHEDVIKWNTYPRYWPLVWRIHRSPVNSPHKGQWRGALMFSLICVGINGWVNNRKAGDLRRQRAYYDVIVMMSTCVSEPGSVFYLLLRVRSDYAHPITGQVTEITCPVIGRAYPELTRSKRQKTGLGAVSRTWASNCTHRYCGM